jgi:regulator of protease activity HflC (stomatin/prohibitin superfamily)
MAEMKLKTGSCLGAIAVALAAIGVITLWTCTEKIPLNKVGVRTLTSSGIEQKDYGAGYVLAIPGFHAVRLWDPTWRNLKETLQVRGSDQYTTEVDISVLIRIEPGKCHEVARHFRDEQHIESLCRNSLSKFANEILAQMKTEDFFNSKIRDQMAGQAQDAMEKQLKEKGIEISNLLIRNIVYDPKFEQQLLQKQLAGQRKSLEMAKGSLAGAQTQTELIKRDAESKVKSIRESTLQDTENLKAEMDRKIAQITQDATLQAGTIVAKAEANRNQAKATAEFKVEQIKQDANLEAASVLSKAESAKRQNTAQAELLQATAVAKSTDLISKAYAKPGAQYYFARKAIEGIKLDDIEVNSTYFNPLDANRLLQAVGLDSSSMKSAPGTKTPSADAAQKP